MVGTNYKIDPDQAHASLGVMEQLPPFTHSWPGSPGALDDSIIEAIATLDPVVARVVADTQRAVNELTAGGDAALALFATAEETVVSQLHAVEATILPELARRPVPYRAGN